MGIAAKEEEVVVHPVDGMQLSEGTIKEDGSHHVWGSLPGMKPLVGETFLEVLERLETNAKVYYGDDVVVEIAPHQPHA